MEGQRTVTAEDYRSLLRIRTGIRAFLHWSEEQARGAGLSAAQHQLLLAVRGHPGPDAPTVGDVAEHLFLRHHSVVQLADRAEAAGLLARRRDGDDHRRVRLEVTPQGEAVLAGLSARHLEELDRLGLTMRQISIRFA